jgi:hypothetical protein
LVQRTAGPLLRILHFKSSGIKEHRVEGVTVRIYNVAKTVVDLFRYRQSAGKRYLRQHRYKNSPGLNLALEGLREALRQRKATPAEIAEYAHDAGNWNMASGERELPANCCRKAYPTNPSIAVTPSLPGNTSAASTRSSTRR